ncbi:MAG: hypothetical protein JSS32_00275 [Verrucomicrobia bacterium]|nr:hypothetical protein [Verrucomicrobiota bacterium]
MQNIIPSSGSSPAPVSPDARSESSEVEALHRIFARASNTGGTPWTEDLSGSSDRWSGVSHISVERMPQAGPRTRQPDFEIYNDFEAHPEEIVKPEVEKPKMTKTDYEILRLQKEIIADFKKHLKQIGVLPLPRASQLR